MNKLFDHLPVLAVCNINNKKTSKTYPINFLHTVGSPLLPSNENVYTKKTKKTNIHTRHQSLILYSINEKMYTRW